MSLGLGGRASRRALLRFSLAIVEFTRDAGVAVLAHIVHIAFPVWPLRPVERQASHRVSHMVGAAASQSCICSAYNTEVATYELLLDCEIPLRGHDVIGADMAALYLGIGYAGTRSSMADGGCLPRNNFTDRLSNLEATCGRLI
jgi:hypothetical protein